MNEIQSQESEPEIDPTKCQKRGCESPPTWGVLVMFYALPPDHPHPLIIMTDADVCDEHRDELAKNPNLVSSVDLIREAGRIMKMNGAMIDPTRTQVAFEAVGSARERREQTRMLRLMQETGTGAVGAEVVDVKAEEGKPEEGKETIQ